MKRFAYTIEIHPADPDETGFWVSVPALPGCFTQGETYEEALANAQEAIACHLEAMISRGEALPEERHPAEKVVVGVTLPAVA